MPKIHTPLVWPADVPRWAGDREASPFRNGWNSAEEQVEDLLRRLGVNWGEIIISTNSAVKETPPDPGVAVYFTFKTRELCVACDRWVKPAHNLKAICRILELIDKAADAGNEGTATTLLDGYVTTTWPGREKANTDDKTKEDNLKPEVRPEDHALPLGPDEYTEFFNRPDRRETHAQFRARRRWEKATGRTWVWNHWGPEDDGNPGPKPQRDESYEPGAGNRGGWNWWAGWDQISKDAARHRQAQAREQARRDEEEALRREQARSEEYARRAYAEQRRQKQQGWQWHVPDPPKPATPGSRHWAAVLEVPPGASNEDVDKSYARLAKLHHPDRGGDAERMKQVNQAYEQFKRERGVK